ncbi:restriction endonuclease subunit S [Citrobacter freundii]|uniref:restriction endonuclease subunit S n=1 Tax=Citrobacter freundii TaxID=546 RepID=UPI0015F76D7C|nr:restriction endonuclease subunit S [Citrobacter freundii]
MEKKLPAGWLLVKVETIAELLRGITYKKEQASNSSEKGFKPIIRANNINGELNFESLVYVPEDLISDSQLIRKDDIVFAMSSGSKHLVGKSARAIYDFDGSYGAFCALVRPSDCLCKPYLYYAFQENSFRILISQVAKGSNINNLKREHILTYSLPLAPLNEQKRIVAKIEELFSELDNGINALNTAYKQLKVYRQAVLKHAFEGKLTAKWREHNNIAKSSWLDTTVQKLALSGPSNGRSVKDRAGGFPVLRLTALKNGKIDLKESKEGAWDKDDAHKYIVNEGDFLFSRGNGSKHLVGRGGLVTKALFDVAFPDTIMRISLDKTKVSPSFFSYLWESRLIRSQIESSARTTAGIYKINQQHVKSFRLMLPSLTEQKVITRIIEEKLSVVDAQLDELEQQIAKAEILRQSILKKAFSGQLVPQDPNDEPASELLARIQAEKKTVTPQKTKKTRKIHSTPGH